ncbi:MAG: virulence RhuM family protein [Kiritimatiellae bacterium]|nr:virulence RhuM family protein [Kiritimatiellia bacterium]
MTECENQIIVYQPNETVRLDVRLENETVWLTQEQMALLFGRDQSVIARHVGNIFKEGELDKNSVYAKNAYTASDGKTYQVAFYNLDVVISVGYRVKSLQGTHFRQWATGVLKEYLIRGYAVNTRLNQLEDKVDRRFAKQESDITELKNKIDFFIQTETPPLQGVFYDGQLWDARALVLKLVSGAKKSLILIDNWATTETIDIFAKKRKGVKLTIFTSEHYDKKHVPHHKISDEDVKVFNSQYPKLTVNYTESFHDRFLIVDDKELYLIGASLKDLGKKCFAFTRLDSGEIERIKKSAFGMLV